MLVLYAIRRMLNKILRYYFSYITILFLPINIKTFQDTIYCNDVFFFNGFFLWFFLIYIFSVCFLQNYSGLMTRIMKASSPRLILVFFCYFFNYYFFLISSFDIGWLRIIWVVFRPVKSTGSYRIIKIIVYQIY
jgi:hypothetical protein